MNRAVKMQAMLVAAAVLACGAVIPAQAADIGSWDKRIDGGATRFTVLAALGSQAVLDKETQLVWQREVSPTARTWFSAMNYCLLVRIGGREGWRLPSMSELTSLVGTAGVLPSGHPFKGIAVNAHFWSSTSSYSTTSTYAATAYLKALTTDHGTVGGKTYTNSALCVRGPGASDRF